MSDIVVEEIPYGEDLVITDSDPEEIVIDDSPIQEELTALSVSDGSAVPVVAEFTADLGTTNFLLLALLFFTIFAWVERKLLHAVRKVVGDE